ncbi:hypothetical protein [Terrabacter sp. 2YAF2]|uniref:hypothetical protein n=1 Tax=Terrabacter sp. 2YAF2 TaxID=3233026 RepID=UPI003F9CBA35
MRRLTIAAAAVAALVPAILGLVGNSSFAQSVPARVPASAQVVPEAGDDNPHTGTPVATPTATRTTEAGDDHGGDRPRDSRTEAGDDHGGDRPRDSRTEAGDDHGGRVVTTGSTSSRSSGSHTSGGHGSDDSGGDDH